MAHYLFSQNKDWMFDSFSSFNNSDIKKAVINHLRLYPNDVVEYCKDYRICDVQRSYGYEIINLYKINPKTNKVSLIVTRGNKKYFRSIEN
jgi:hypothetical protein